MDVEKIVREYIDKTVHLSLATVKDNKPWVCEVHFAYDEKLNLFFRSLTSRRHSQEIAENPHVAGNIVDKYPLGTPAVGVYFEGTAKLINGGDEQNEAARYIQDRLKAPEGILQEAARADGYQFYKITIENWYVFGKLMVHHLKNISSSGMVV